MDDARPTWKQKKTQLAGQGIEEKKRRFEEEGDSVLMLRRK